MTIIAPAAKSILTQATLYRPNRSKASDGTLGDAAHASRKSDHNPNARGIVLASDLTDDPGRGMDAHAWIRWRCARGDRRIKYAISNGEWWKPDGRGWRPYTGSNPHTKHVHTSIVEEYAYDVSEWFNGFLFNPPPAPTPPEYQPPPPVRKANTMLIRSEGYGLFLIAPNGAVAALNATEFSRSQASGVPVAELSPASAKTILGR